jgi:hypothetical protein
LAERSALGLSSVSFGAQGWGLLMTYRSAKYPTQSCPQFSPSAREPIRRRAS